MPRRGNGDRERRIQRRVERKKYLWKLMIPAGLGFIVAVNLLGAGLVIVFLGSREQWGAGALCSFCSGFYILAFLVCMGLLRRYDPYAPVSEADLYNDDLSNVPPPDDAPPDDHITKLP